MVLRINSLENANFLQSIAEEDRRDKIQEDAFLRSTEENLYLKRVQFNTALCHALKEEKRVEFMNRKRDQLRRNGNIDLRQLEIQLRAAYVSKSVAAQRFEHDALAMEDKAVRRTLHDMHLEKGRLTLDEYAKGAEKEAQQKKDAVKRELQEQMAYMEAQRMEKKLEKQKETEMVIAAMKKYKEDQMQELHDIREKKLKLKLDLDQFRKDQDIAKAKNKERSEAGISNDMAERIRRRDQEKQRVEQNKKDQQKRRNEISERIGMRTFEIKEKSRKALDTLIDLLIDERKAKENIKQKQDDERKKQLTIVIRHDLDLLQEAKMLRIYKQRKLDEDYKNKISLYLDDRHKLLEQKDEMKKRKINEHRKSLHNAFDEKKKFRAEEMKNNILIMEHDIQEQKRKKHQVELERAEMLKEHLPHLVGFIPPKMLRESEKKLISNLK